MKKIKKFILWYHKLKISKKLYTSFILISIIPIFIIQAISYFTTTKMMHEQVDELSSLNLKQSYNNFKSSIKIYENILFEVYTDDLILKNMEYINLWDTIRYVSAINAIDKKLQDAIFSKDSILGIATVSIYGETVYYDTISHSNVDSFCFELNNITEADWYKQALLSNDVVYGKTRVITNSEGTCKNILYIARKLVNFKTSEKPPVGVVVIAVDEEKLEATYNQNKGELGWNFNFIIDSNANIISFPDKKYIGDNIYSYLSISEYDLDIKDIIKKFVKETNVVKSSNLIIKTLQSQENNFIAVNVQDEEYMFGKVRIISSIIVILGVGVIIFAYLTIHYASKQIVRSAKGIIDAMDIANKGNLNVQINVSGGDEFSEIAHNFNIMISKMKLLIENEIISLNRRKEAEIRALEAQINPHFLYNTLDSINWMAIEKEEYEISKMLKNLAIILRYSINKSNEIVTISQEIDYLKKYVHLQQNRFDYSFDCIIKINDNAKNCKIHKLLLQPIIENSIIHGFSETSENDIIEVEICLLNSGFLCIVISDNGKGIESKIIDELNNYNYDQNNIQTSIGIRNVIARIKMYYGEEGKFDISINDKGGTTVEILIPNLL